MALAFFLVVGLCFAELVLSRMWLPAYFNEVYRRLQEHYGVG